MKRESAYSTMGTALPDSEKNGPTLAKEGEIARAQ